MGANLKIGDYLGQPTYTEGSLIIEIGELKEILFLIFND
jgi:hypothetical protein